MKVVVAGAYGAFGRKHLEALSRIEGAEVTSVMGRCGDQIRELAQERKIDHFTTDLDELIANPNVDAVILSTPTPLHAAQSKAVMQGGKHCFCEIPMADNLADARELVDIQREAGVMGMVGHVRRFNPSHKWIHQRIKSGNFRVQQLDVQTYFFRRTNSSADGRPRTWTDDLLWHHACHTVDLFVHQVGEIPDHVFCMKGPNHPDMNIPMDMSIGLKSPSGALCTLSLSFNNDGPLGSSFRYIGDTGTYVARYDELYDGYDRQIDLSLVADSSDGIELIDREFLSAIKDGREPESSFQQALVTMQVLDRIRQAMV